MLLFVGYDKKAPVKKLKTYMSFFRKMLDKGIFMWYNNQAVKTVHIVF